MLKSLPPCLTFHLKRFRMTHKGRSEKIAKHVSFPLTIDMAPFCHSPDQVGCFCWSFSIPIFILCYLQFCDVERCVCVCTHTDVLWCLLEGLPSSWSTPARPLLDHCLDATLLCYWKFLGIEPDRVVFQAKFLYSFRIGIVCWELTASFQSLVTNIWARPWENHPK